MCWIGDLKIKKAEADIPVFKVMMYDPNEANSVTSYYFPTKYKIGELKESSIIPGRRGPFTGLYTVNIALHSYNPLKVGVIRRNIGMGFDVLSILYNNDRILDNVPPSLLIIKGYIPKEACYCENEKGEFISDKLVMTEICDPE